jgi:NAD(P)-dependent dehydrogenase (short-subunit alcohol dehydrogenase family)
MTLDSISSSELTLRDRRVVIVGGTSGMGLGAARLAARAGAEVVVAGRRPLAERRAVEAGAGSVTHAVVDATEEASVATLFDEVGELDHLFVTAAPSFDSPRSLTEQDVATARRYVDAKLWGSWACARYAVPRLRPGGSLTFLTGGFAVRPRPGAAFVTVAFAAVEALARGLAVDLAPVRVNTIRPGLVDSDMWNFLDDTGRAQLRERAARYMPARRIGTIEDIGHAAVFLMTNPYVTGTVLEVSGGETLVDSF